MINSEGSVPVGVAVNKEDNVGFMVGVGVRYGGLKFEGVTCTAALAATIAI